MIRSSQIIHPFSQLCIQKLPSFNNEVISTTLPWQSTLNLSSASSHLYQFNFQSHNVLNPNEKLVKLRFGDGCHNYSPVHIFGKDSTKRFKISCSPYQAGHKLENLQMSAYASNKVYLPYRNYQEGVLNELGVGTVINYKVIADGDEIGFHVAVFSENGRYIGYSYVSINKSISDYEEIIVPLINDNNQIIGSLSCYVLQVKGIQNPPVGNPFANSNPYKSLRHYQPMEIGHRGCGVTGTDKELQSSLPCIPENTIASMTLAYLHGADMIETDVVVTQDLKPVLYHDLEYVVKEKCFPVSSISYKLLQNLPEPKLRLSSDQVDEQLFGQEGQAVRQSIKNMVLNQNKCFPSLQEALEKLPSKLGIMLEVKSNLAEEGIPQISYHNKNCSVDAVLNILLESAGDRPIILCSFCHSTCIMLKNKQNRWPVVLTVMGSTDVYSDFVDKRHSCLSISKSFALSEKLYGLSVFSELMVPNPEDTIKDLNESGLSIFAWGHHNTCKQFRKELRNADVDGIIYDKIYEEGLQKRTMALI